MHLLKKRKYLSEIKNISMSYLVTLDVKSEDRKIL